MHIFLTYWFIIPLFGMLSTIPYTKQCKENIGNFSSRQILEMTTHIDTIEAKAVYNSHIVIVISVFAFKLEVWKEKKSIKESVDYMLRKLVVSHIHKFIRLSSQSITYIKVH